MDLVFTFSGGIRSVNQNSGYIAKSCVCARPFKFLTGFEYNIEFNMDGSLHVLNRKLPLHSVLSQNRPSNFLEKNDLLTFAVGCIDQEIKFPDSNESVVNCKEVLHILNAFPLAKGIRSDILADNFGFIAKNSVSGKLGFSCIYGLHYYRLREYKFSIIRSWLGANKIVSENIGKPIILLVKFYGRVRKDELLVKFHDLLLKIVEAGKDNLKETLQTAKPGDVLICDIPNLPKPLFSWIINKSTMPVLVEGANLTTELLNTAHPYLALRPRGDTRIPYTIGDPLEAIKADAFSSKLRIDKKLPEAEKLRLLYQWVRAGNYQQAYTNLCTIQDEFDQDQAVQPSTKKYALLRFLWDKEVDSSKMSATFSLMNLLEMAANSRHERLPSCIQEVLEAALAPPDPDFLSAYILESINQASSIARHYEMIRETLKQPINHSIVTGVYQLGVAKGQIKPVILRDPLLKLYENQLVRNSTHSPMPPHASSPVQ